MVKQRLQIINNVASVAVIFVRMLPADLEENILSCETPIPNAPPSDFCIKIEITNKIINGVCDRWSRYDDV